MVLIKIWALDKLNRMVHWFRENWFQSKITFYTPLIICQRCILTKLDFGSKKRFKIDTDMHTYSKRWRIQMGIQKKLVCSKKCSKTIYIEFTLILHDSHTLITERDAEQIWG
jgi:hypothetical protein